MSTDGSSGPTENANGDASPAKSNVVAAYVLGISLIVAALISTKASNDVGRYQLGGPPGHLCVIDTTTGQIWYKFAPESSSIDVGKDGWSKPK
jgi:hypothetical protein